MTDTAYTPAAFTPKSIEPTPEQLLIQTATARTLIVQANAGAAKTTTLALRMAESWVRGCAPEKMLALTFTTTACQALKAALHSMGVPNPVVKRFRIVTFESFCTKVLDELVGGAVPILATAEALKPTFWEAVEHIENNADEQFRDELLLPSLGEHGILEEFLSVSRRLKGTMKDEIERERPVTPDYAASLGVDYTQLKLFLAYERLRRHAHAEKPLFRADQDATYDLACKLHDDEPLQGLTTWPWDIRVLVVDEMHDLNQAMFRVLKALLTTTPSFFCGVGDPDQVIYDADGAEAKFMADEIESQTRRQITRFQLTDSFRFSKTLASRVGRLSAKPYSSKSLHETKVIVQYYSQTTDKNDGSKDVCAHLVVECVRLWQTKPKPKMAELAILLRHPYQSVAIENVFLEAGIPYVTQGFESYLLRPEVLLVRGILAVATDNLSSVASDVTRAKVMQALVFFCQSTLLVEGREHESQQALLDDAIRSVTVNPEFLHHFFENQILKNVDVRMKQHLEAAMCIAKTASGPDLLVRLLDALHIKTMVNTVFVSRQRRTDALGNLKGLVQAAKNFETAGAYFQHLNNIEVKQMQLKKTTGLLIANVVDVKGLEFDHVVVPYLNKGEFPAAHAAPREEQNLLYVAMTRARRFLTVFSDQDQPSSLMAKIA